MCSFPRFFCPCRALAKLASVLEPTGLQEEAELPAQLLAEFVMVRASMGARGAPGSPHGGNGRRPQLCPLSQQDSRKKDKLLCSQLQVVDFLQNFLAQEDTAHGGEPLASEDTSREREGGLGWRSGQLFG